MLIGRIEFGPIATRGGFLDHAIDLAQPLDGHTQGNPTPIMTSQLTISIASGGNFS
jgi:hypothetical protein